MLGSLFLPSYRVDNFVEAPYVVNGLSVPSSTQNGQSVPIENNAGGLIALASLLSGFWLAVFISQDNISVSCCMSPKVVGLEFGPFVTLAGLAAVSVAGIVLMVQATRSHLDITDSSVRS